MRGRIIPTETSTLAQIERDPCTAALLTWLEGKAENTRRSYVAALRSLLDFAQKHPSEIAPLDIPAAKKG